MLIFISVFIGIKRVLVVVFIASGGLLLAHPGNLDSRSGHKNHRTGAYHFHTPTGQAVTRNPIQERHWQKVFNDKVLKGELEHYVQGGRDRFNGLQITMTVFVRAKPFTH